MDHPIVVTSLGKRFARHGYDRPSTLKELVLRGHSFSKAPQFWGLREVSFQVRKGRAVGVVGRNGAGKSTLLRLISGIGRPDEGRVQVRGRIGAILDLGAGLTGDLTGRENIFILGVLAGMTRAEVKARMADIVRFAELEAFVDDPVRIYSSGMRMRLAFAVAAHIDPDVLLLDEVLAVGDASFQRKCLDRIATFKSAGCTIFLVSHEAETVRALCDEVLFLREGRMVAFGPADEVMDLYEGKAEEPPAVEPDAAVEHHGPADVRLHDGSVLRYWINRFGSQEAQIQDVQLLDAKGQRTSRIACGEGLTVRVDYDAKRLPQAPIVCIGIHQPDGTTCGETNTELIDPGLPRGGKARIDLRIDRLDLCDGDYFINIGLYHPETWEPYDCHLRVYRFQVTGLSTQVGVLNPPWRWELG